VSRDADLCTACPCSTRGPAKPSLSWRSQQCCSPSEHSQRGERPNMGEAGTSEALFIYVTLSCPTRSPARTSLRGCTQLQLLATLSNARTHAGASAGSFGLQHVLMLLPRPGSHVQRQITQTRTVLGLRGLAPAGQLSSVQSRSNEIVRLR
jgi:hypothetical protein